MTLKKDKKDVPFLSFLSEDARFLSAITYLPTFKLDGGVKLLSNFF